MDAWTAWRGAPGLSFLHERVRRLLVSQGVEESFVDVGGRPVHVYTAGPETATRTVVLLHGLGSSANDWWHALPLLAWRGDRVIAIDLPGHGWSPPFDERGFLQVREHADVVRAVVREKSVGRDLALVGHSLGGWVGARAILGGLPVSRIVLAEAAGLEYEGMWDSIELLRIEGEADAKRFFRTICHRPPVALNLLTKEVTAMFRAPAVANFLSAYHRDDLVRDEELATIRVPTTVVWGENDGLIPPILAHRWHTGIAGSRLVWLPRCGHAPQLERPILFQSVLEEALGHPSMGNEIRARLTARMPEMLRRRFGPEKEPA